MARVLVTGGAGFVGSHLVDALVARGDQVLVVDDFSRGKAQYLEEASRRGSLTIREADIRSPDVSKFTAEFGPDVVFHLAGLNFIPYCLAHPVETMDVNVLGFDRLLRALHTHPPRSLVFTSSAAVYGFGECLNEASAVSPADVYGLSKWTAEELLRRYADEMPSVSCVAARLFSPYGPRDTNPRLVPEIVSAVRDGRTPGLGNLWPKRDFIYVKDVRDALIRLSDLPSRCEAVNVGTGVGVTAADMIRAIERLTGRTLQPREATERMRSSDGHRVADVSLLRARTGFRPRYDLESGLHELLLDAGLIPRADRITEGRLRNS